MRCACRREDLEDLLADQTYFQAVFHSLEQVKALYQAQAELGMANESIARESLLAMRACVSAAGADFLRE